jgi:ubiquinone/menaquinone biosynthesis C-methylase UbiE
MSWAKVKDFVFDLPIVFDIARWTVMGSYNPMFNNAQKFISVKDGEKVLEVGCGTGIFSHLFGDDYVGVDFFPGFIEKAKDRNPEVKFKVMDAMNMDFSEVEFDKVLLFNFLHHMSDEQFDKVMKECLRIGKKVFIMEPVEQPYNPVAWFLYWMDRGAYIRKFKLLKGKLNNVGKVSRYHMFRSFIYKMVMVEVV